MKLEFKLFDVGKLNKIKNSIKNYLKIGCVLNDIKRYGEYKATKV